MEKTLNGTKRRIENTEDKKRGYCRMGQNVKGDKTSNEEHT
jgi:hypothetical protein